MDLLLSKVTAQAVNYAIRSGITITGGYAIKQCARLLKAAPKGSTKEELLDLQLRLESKIRIISPAIDMIELIAARGNTTLESAVTLTKELRWEIQSLGVRLSSAANEEELLRRKSSRAKSREQNELELKLVTTQVRRLLSRIEDAVPLINLAITTSGVSLSTTLPATISPSRLLQASTFLSAADGTYAADPSQPVQVGPTHTLSLYMLFAGHAWRPQDDESVRETTWKEVIHKARVKLVRVRLDSLYELPHATDGSDHHNGASHSIPGEGAAFEFAYQLVLIEDLDDDRVHSFDDEEQQPSPFEDVAIAGIRDLIPIHEISKIFYADTGKILNIGAEGETNSPVLLLKRDNHAEAPRRMMERQQTADSDSDDEAVDSADKDTEDFSTSPIDEQTELDAQFRRESSVGLPDEEKAEISHHSQWRLPPDLDPEWIALEVYNEEPDTDGEDEVVSSDTRPTSSKRTSSRHGSLDPALTGALSKLNLKSPSPMPSELRESTNESEARHLLSSSPTTPIKTSLSLLEMLIRLTALQQFRQASHLTIEDELLNFFLEDSATTGAGPNAEYRQRVRRDARRRVGFDPYDESPIKRRGEEYLAHPRASPRPNEDWERQSYFGDDDSDRQWEGDRSPSYARPSVENQRFPNRSSATPSSPSPVLRPRPVSNRSSPMPATPGLARSAGSLATPPGSYRSRAAVLRSQSEKPKSPLGRVGLRGKADSTLGTSPSSDNVNGREV